MMANLSVIPAQHNATAKSSFASSIVFYVWCVYPHARRFVP